MCFSAICHECVITVLVSIMPELPEVETIMQGVRSVLEGKRIQTACVHRPDLRRPFPPYLTETLSGAQVCHVRRRAKYILIDLADGHTLLIHLGMSGRLFIEDSPATHPSRKHEHFLIVTEEGTRLSLVDPRRFGMVDLFPSQAPPLFMQKLGMEPLAEGALTPTRLEKMFHTVRVPIKNALLDQTKIVGLGNIYVCEALFRTGIHPQTPAQALSRKDHARLSIEIPAILQEAIAAGGSSLRDYVTTDGTKGTFQTLHQVYGRTGEQCRVCAQKGHDAVIERITQAGRSTFFCPHHQKSRDKEESPWKNT